MKNLMSKKLNECYISLNKYYNMLGCQEIMHQEDAITFALLDAAAKDFCSCLGEHRGKCYNNP